MKIFGFGFCVCDFASALPLRDSHETYQLNSSNQDHLIHSRLPMADQISPSASQDQQILTSSNEKDAKDQDTLALLQSGASDEQDDADEPVFKPRRKGGAAAKNLRKRKRDDESQESETHDVDSEVLYAEFFALIDFLCQTA